MFRKMSIIFIGMSFLIGCANPYVQKLQIYEMQLSEGRDKAFLEAFKVTERERLDVEDQFARLSLENTLLISAFVRSTGKKPEEIMLEKTFSFDEIMKIVDERNRLRDIKKEEIKEGYKKFFEAIKTQDDKIEAIREGVKQAEEIRDETYQKVGETLAIGAGAAAMTIAIPK